ALRKNGIANFSTDILPVQGQGDISRTLVSYGTVTARAPEGCEMMGGLDGKATGSGMEYQQGCTIEMILARQIARPADLAGRPGLDAGSGRRAANITDDYHM